MLLVIDVGNTNIVVGVFQGESLAHRFRVQTIPGRTADEFGVLLADLFHHRGVAPQIRGAIISCVVPDQLHALQQTCRHYFDIDPLIVGPGIRTGLPILAENPREVGADRIVNSVAAYDLVGGGCVVVDFGTATTFDCVSPKGEYLGGAIAPGFQISAEALFRRTSKLPQVEVHRPQKVIGRNTIHSMQSGLYYGYVGLVDGLVGRIMEEMGEDLRVLATGGLAAVLSEASHTIDEVAEDLTLHGLRILNERNT
ncbi:MAG TPA: type III pantothenate kinase [Deltaproteobacteria bacterium]|nr:pantothenate kinase [Deltaproteobacteria bacterium]HCP48035.1 type III pantothenate kinase [Deltaproteobacteria bacterium]